jgi:hypothetical protein
LWQQGEQLSRYPPNPRFTYSDARTLALKLRAWYFSDQGGMYLSGEAQVAYRRLQEALGKLPVGHGAEGLWETAQSDYERLHAAFSALRTELTADLQSRVRSPLDQVSSKSPQNEERGLLRGRTSGFPGMSDC